jgi:arylsulfatase A-like enzyme
MSRTFRRKNYEETQGNSWGRKGWKTNGYYTAYDGSWYYWNNTGQEVVFRPMNKEEYRHEFLRVHGESRSNNAWTPSRWYRNNKEVSMRMRNKQELVKYRKDPDYEPMVEDVPPSHYWDWR